MNERKRRNADKSVIPQISVV